MKITKKQIKRMLAESTWYQNEKPSKPSLLPDQIDDLNYFQDQVEEAYARISAEVSDIEDMLPDYVLTKINEALNSLENANMAVAKFTTTSKGT